MLRTNSKKAKENIKKYIIKNTHLEGHNLSLDNFATTDDLFKYILFTYMLETRETQPNYYSFEDWCDGLPSIIDTCYVYNRSAVKDLGDILEETEEERGKFSESQAEILLTKLIYRALLSSFSS